MISISSQIIFHSSELSSTEVSAKCKFLLIYRSPKGKTRSDRNGAFLTFSMTPSTDSFLVKFSTVSYRQTKINPSLQNSAKLLRGHLSSNVGCVEIRERTRARLQKNSAPPTRSNDLRKSYITKIRVHYDNRIQVGRHRVSKCFYVEHWQVSLSIKNTNGGTQFS